MKLIINFFGQKSWTLNFGVVGVKNERHVYPFHSSSSKIFTILEQNQLCDIQGGDNGLIARSATYLFEAMKAHGQNVSSGQKPFIMRASYFEIYTEQVIRLKYYIH